MFTQNKTLNHQNKGRAFSEFYISENINHAFSTCQSLRQQWKTVNGEGIASSFILRVPFIFSTDTLCTSDNMKTQAKLGETSTLYADISVQVFGEWHLLCFLHGYITSGRKAVNHGKKSKLGTRRKSRLHPGRQETRFYMGLTVAVLRGRWQAAMPASLWVLQLRDVICLWNSSE